MLTSRLPTYLPLQFVHVQYKDLKLTILLLRLGVLHTIFFHRYFPCVRPDTFDVLDLTLPAIDDVELETLIDSRVNTLIRQHLSPASNSPNGGVRGRLAVQFFEKKRRKGGLWFGGLAGKNEEEVCWEIWTVNVTIATPRTESGVCWILCDQKRAVGTFLTELNRPCKSPQGHGKDVAEGRFQDSCHSQPEQGPYTAHYNQRFESFPVSDCSKS